MSLNTVQKPNSYHTMTVVLYILRHFFVAVSSCTIMVLSVESTLIANSMKARNLG